MRKIDSGPSVKRPGSAIVGESGSGAKKRSRKLDEIPEDAWLDVLKYLICQKWSKMRLVTRKFNGVVQRNVSRLPMAIIDSFAMRRRVIHSTKEQMETESKIIVSDSTILPDEQDQWFKNRGITIDLPTNIQLDNAVIGEDLKENSCVDLCVLGSPQKEALTPSEQARPWYFGQQFKTEVLFYAEFSPHRNKYSWASIAFFLKLLYDQSTYVKELLMYGLDKKLKEYLVTDEGERYIRCGSFAFQVMSYASVVDLCESVWWLEHNVQADIIQFPKGIRYYDNLICDAMSNYLLGSSWISANQVVKLAEINDVECFFETLIEKFPTVAVESIFPTLVFCGNQSLCCDSLNNQLFGKSIVKEKLEDLKGDSDDSQCNEIYTISSGSNRMRIKFFDYV